VFLDPAILLKDGFDESQHPRDDAGRFSDGGGGGGSGNDYVSIRDQSLDPKHASALNRYVGKEYRYANDIARGRADRLTLTELTKGESLFDDMNAMFADVPLLKEPMTLFRGQPLASQLGIDVNDPDALVGSQFTDHGWTSTTESERTAESFAKDFGKDKFKDSLLFKIFVKTGVKLLNVAIHSYLLDNAGAQHAAKTESEMLLNRGNTFKITGHSRSKNGLLLLTADHSHTKRSN